MGLSTILFLIFLVLKLTGNIDWSWWWIFAPLIVEFVIGTILMIFFGGLAIFGMKKANNTAHDRIDRSNYF